MVTLPSSRPRGRPEGLKAAVLPIPTASVETGVDSALHRGMIEIDRRQFPNPVVFDASQNHSVLPHGATRIPPNAQRYQPPAADRPGSPSTAQFVL